MALTMSLIGDDEVYELESPVQLLSLIVFYERQREISSWFPWWLISIYDLILGTAKDICMGPLSSRISRRVNKKPGNSFSCPRRRCCFCFCCRGHLYGKIGSPLGKNRGEGLGT